MTQVPEDEIKPTYYVKFKGILKKFGISVAEWHSLGVGVGTAVIAGPALAAAVFTAATTAKGLKGHMKDLKKEIGYFIGSFCVVEYGMQALQVIL